jgi:hypothetical protein
MPSQREGEIPLPTTSLTAVKGAAAQDFDGVLRTQAIFTHFEVAKYSKELVIPSVLQAQIEQA